MKALPKMLVLLLSQIWIPAISTIAQTGDHSIILDKEWFIQSSDKVIQTGEIISNSSYKITGWFPGQIPSTVLGTLVDNKVYPDPFYAKNLDAIPREQFQKSWWYRKTFVLPDKSSYSYAELIFDGINYRANIFLNGKKIASADSLFGAFRQFIIDITKSLKVGENILAVEVFPPKPGEFSIGWVDWAPRPNDENMGIFRPVRVKLTGDVSMDHIFVQSKLDSITWQDANLTITAEITNHTHSSITTTLKGKIDSLEFDQKISLLPNQRKLIEWNTKTHPVLNIHSPKLWWPYQMGTPYLYKLSIECTYNQLISDKQSFLFGIRDVKDYHNPDGSVGYKINGRKMLLLGGGWSDELFLREKEENLEGQILLTKNMHLNTIRLEGYWGCSQKLYDLCDQYGILIMVGFSCHWEWPEYLGKETDEFGGVKTTEDMALVNHYLHDQVIMHRNHPSIFVWVNGSDDLPRPALADLFKATLKSIDQTRPVLWSCKEYKSETLGETGSKMVGPYDYVTPNYWYLKTKYDGPFGFNTETGPGAQIPAMETLRKIIPKDSMWPLNSNWDYHCARLNFESLDRFLLPLEKRYGKPSNLDEFILKSNLASYEAIRPMFETITEHIPGTTGIIHWMLNGSWPRLIWQLYDNYLTPTSAYYGTLKACQPINILYDYGNKNIYASNYLYIPYSDLKADIKILDLNSNIVYKQTVSFDLGEYQSKKLTDLNIPASLGPVYFLDLKIRNKDNSVVADNFYWLSSKDDKVDTSKCDWINTPNLEYADFTALRNLPTTKLELTQINEEKRGQKMIHVTLKNNSNIIAFFVELKLKGNKTGFVPMPVYWSDNLISILPGESKTVTVSFTDEDLKGEDPMIIYSGWNVH